MTRGARSPSAYSTLCASACTSIRKKPTSCFNLEATPAEGTSYRFALLDKDQFPDIVAAGL